jgi:hypothetical protein
LSPVEIVDACIARIGRRNPSLNAFIFNSFDAGRREAIAAEEAIMSGGAVGPLHGAPSAIKDLFDFKPGWPFTFGGVRAMRNCVANWHCVLAERIEKAGAILLGKKQPDHGPARRLRQLPIRHVAQFICRRVIRILASIAAPAERLVKANGMISATNLIVTDWRRECGRASG